MVDVNQETAPRAQANGNVSPDPADTEDTTVEGATSEHERLLSNLVEFERLFGVDEDAYEQPTTTRRELWSYYLYYNGNRPSTAPHRATLTRLYAGDNGVGPGSYSQAL